MDIHHDGGQGAEPVTNQNEQEEGETEGHEALVVLLANGRLGQFANLFDQNFKRELQLARNTVVLLGLIGCGKEKAEHNGCGKKRGGDDVDVDRLSEEVRERVMSDLDCSKHAHSLSPRSLATAPYALTANET